MVGVFYRAGPSGRLVVAAPVGGGVMILEVEDRRRDLGVLRAIGGSRASLFGGVATEAAVFVGLGTAFGLAPGDAGYDAMRDEFLQRYEARMTRETCVFADVVPLLAWLDEERLAWGIVTNKATRFAEPLVRHPGLASPAAVLGLGRLCGMSVPAYRALAPGFGLARRLRFDRDTAQRNRNRQAMDRPARSDRKTIVPGGSRRLSPSGLGQPNR